jgi:hypothetical protein
VPAGAAAGAVRVGGAAAFDAVRWGGRQAAPDCSQLHPPHCLQLQCCTYPGLPCHGVAPAWLPFRACGALISCAGPRLQHAASAAVGPPIPRRRHPTRDACGEPRPASSQLQHSAPAALARAEPQHGSPQPRAAPPRFGAQQPRIKRCWPPAAPRHQQQQQQLQQQRPERCSSSSHSLPPPQRAAAASPCSGGRTGVHRRRSRPLDTPRRAGAGPVRGMRRRQPQRSPPAPAPALPPLATRTPRHAPQLPDPIAPRPADAAAGGPSPALGGDEPLVSPRKEAKMTLAQYQEIYDRLIKIFQERPRDDWKKLIVLSAQWPQHSKGVFDRWARARGAGAGAAQAQRRHLPAAAPQGRCRSAVPVARPQGPPRSRAASSLPQRPQPPDTAHHTGPAHRPAVRRPPPQDPRAGRPGGGRGQEDGAAPPVQVADLGERCARCWRCSARLARLASVRLAAGVAGPAACARARAPAGAAPRAGAPAAPGAPPPQPLGPPPSPPSPPWRRRRRWPTRWRATTACSPSS